jgi:FHS family glucose/mannose:H+ symporter-like MFS transporter
VKTAPMDVTEGYDHDGSWIFTPQGQTGCTVMSNEAVHQNIGGGGAARATLLLYVGFVGTGIGIALPGVLLPALLMQWHLQDEQGGRLFLFGWIGSSLGALSVRGSLRTTLAVGCATTALGAVGLALCAGVAADALMGLYGLGLGMTMTSISLIRQQQTAGQGTEMVRLNLAWAIGAVICPFLALRLIAQGSIRPILFAVAGLFGMLALFSTVHHTLQLDGAKPGQTGTSSPLRDVPFGLLLLTLLATGIEASAGGWLTTYAHRDGYNLAETIAAPTCFWAGLLLSRLFWTIVAGWLSELWIVRLSLTLMAASSVALVATQHGPLTVSAAFCLGFGLGPTYPLLLSWALRLHRGGTIFFIAGLGSACLPWLTGLISARYGSLRMGLAVPLASSLVMLLVAWLSPVRLWSERSARD